MQEEQITRMYRDMGISESVYRFGAQIESRLKDRFDEIRPHRGIQPDESHPRHAGEPCERRMFSVYKRIRL